MKKVLSMLLFVATAIFATSCDEAEDLIGGILGDDNSVSYTGDCVVSSYGIAIYTQEDATCTLEEDGSTISIEMQEVQFSEDMPGLTIKISDIPASNGSFSIDSITPTIAGIPFEDYELTDVSGTYSSSSLTISFECMSLDVAFSGSAE